MIRVGRKAISDSVFTSLRVVLKHLRTIHVRYAMLASSDAVLFADSTMQKEQELEILKDVGVMVLVMSRRCRVRWKDLKVGIIRLVIGY